VIDSLQMVVFYVCRFCSLDIRSGVPNPRPANVLFATGSESFEMLRIWDENYYSIAAFPNCIHQIQYFQCKMHWKPSGGWDPLGPTGGVLT